MKNVSTLTRASDAQDAFAAAPFSAGGRIRARYTASAGAAQEASIGTGLALDPTTGVLSNTSPSNGVASDANVRAATGTGDIISSQLASAAAIVTVTYAATTTLAWDTFINADITLTANVTLANPTGVVAGTFRTLLVKGSSATARTIAFGTNFKGSIPSIADVTSTKYYLLTMYAYTTTHIIVTSVQAL